MLLAHVIALLLLGAALMGLSTLSKRSREFSEEMQGLDRAGRLVEISRVPTSDAVVLEPRAGGRVRRLTWRDRIGQVTYVVDVDPETGTLVQFGRLAVEYRYGWWTAWNATWVAIAALGLSVLVQVTISLVRQVNKRS